MGVCIGRRVHKVCFCIFLIALSACIEELFPSVVICNDNVAFLKLDTEGVAGMRCILVKNH